MAPLPAQRGKVGQAITQCYVLVGLYSVLNFSLTGPSGVLLWPVVAFLTDLPFEQYEHPLAHIFSSLGRGRDLPAVRSIGAAGPAFGGLPSHGPPGGLYFAESRNLRATSEVSECLWFSHFC